MRAIGLDVGTTTICAIVLDAETGVIIDTTTIKNNAFIASKKTWEKIQDPSIIMDNIEKIISQLTAKYAPIACIGITGQMHGIVYLNQEGEAVSPLYTWQDGRGDLPFKGNLSYAEYLSKTTGYKMATGFGTLTHFYHVANGLVPETARYICTIQDYAAMRLCRLAKPLVHPTDAASLGLYNMETNLFDHQVIRKTGMKDAFLPDVSQGIQLLGETEAGIPVAVAIGDNQASFLGSVSNNEECVLVNIGTGSQVSLFVDNYRGDSQVELRPFAGEGFLLAGSALCGGRAYALLEGFFRSVVHMATGKESPGLYDCMENLAYEFPSLENRLEISTRFCGTRDNPSLRGVIGNIGIDNFTPQHFIVGVLEGIIKELYGLYEVMLPGRSPKPTVLVGSGNGIRMNVPLQRMISKMFQMPMRIPLYKEEAAYGAALFSLICTGRFQSVSEAQRLIQYS